LFVANFSEINGVLGINSRARCRQVAPAWRPLYWVGCFIELAARCLACTGNMPCSALRLRFMHALLTASVVLRILVLVSTQLPTLQADAFEPIILT
jgi:hypothetical protein